jgi:hypothetical protein
MQWRTVLLAVASLALVSSAPARPEGEGPGKAGPEVKAGRPGLVNPGPRKEPTYRGGSPNYCLFLFGTEAKTRVWLVFDGDDLFIDRNANGDLTEEGEKVVPKEKEEVPGGTTRYVFQAGPVTEADGKTRHPSLVFMADRGKDGRWSLYSTTVHVRGKYGETVLTPQRPVRVVAGRPAAGLPLGTRPKEAPVLHFHAPLTLADWPIHPMELRRGMKGDVQLTIVGKVAAGALAPWVSITSVPKDAHPVAEIELPSSAEGAKPLQVKVVLDQRCCGNRFYASFPVPATAAGRAKVELSFPAWKDGGAAPATLEVPVR